MRLIHIILIGLGIWIIMFAILSLLFLFIPFP
jgi:hypothetical protein